MFTWLTNRSASLRKARDLYGAVVAQARQPEFYRSFGVADTPEGRYELIALHLILLLERLGRADVANEELRRETLEAFVVDMDDAMREFGVGDVTVPKRVKKAAGGVYARGVAYRAALGEPDDSMLEGALVAHVFEGREVNAAGPLARYVRAAVAALDAQSGSDLKAGRVSFPAPQAVS